MVELGVSQWTKALMESMTMDALMVMIRDLIRRGVSWVDACTALNKDLIMRHVTKRSPSQVQTPATVETYYCLL